MSLKEQANSPLLKDCCRAEVIKLEVPRKGDDSRHWGPPFMQHTDKENSKAFTKGIDRQSAYFVAVNRNKKSVTVNLKTKRGIQIARELAKSADILIENVRMRFKLKKMRADMPE